jgi:MYXO-CTERM domain-containing protein
MILLACSSAPSSTEQISQSSSAIINGKASDGSQDAVVLLFYPIGMSAWECTGTLLAPNLILTARHCVSKTVDQPFLCDKDGVGSSGGDVGADFTPSNIYVVTGTKRPYDPSISGNFAAKGQKIIHDGAKNLCNHDLALLLLDRPVANAHIVPVRMDTPAVAKETFTAVGWGVTTQAPEPSTRQQRTGVAVKDVGPTTDPDVGLGVPDHEFMVGESICQGDSGGPAISDQTGAIMGVVSRGGNGQGDPNDPSSGCIQADNFYSMASAYKDMILDAYSQAGQDPWPEGGPDPRLAKFGEDCSGDDACRSGVCLTDKTGAPTTCTQGCDKDTPCPDGYVCPNTGNPAYCVVKPPPIPTTTTTTSTCAVSSQSSSNAALAWGVGALALAFVSRRRRR